MRSMRSLKREFKRRQWLDMVGLERRHSMAERVAGVCALFGAGMLVGAGLGVLFAPRTGRQLRGELKERFEEGMPRAKEVIQSAVEQARSMNPRSSAPHS